MPGTGLPIPKNDNVLTIPAPALSASAFSVASSWEHIAASGEKIQTESAHYLAKEVHQAQLGQIASFEVDQRDKTKVARDTFAKDPEGFKNWSQATTDGAISEVPDWMVPHAKSFLSTQHGAAYAGITAERRALDLRNDAEQVHATIAMDGSDVITAAAAGTLVPNAGTEVRDPRILKLTATLDAAVNSELMAPAKRDQILEEVVGKAHGETAAREGLRIYRETGGNYQAAVDHLKTSILENEDLTLKPSARHAAFNAGMQALNRERLADKADRGDIVQAGKDLQARITSGQPYDEAEVRDTANALGRVGAVAQQSRLVIEHTVRQETAGLSTPELAVAAVRNRVATAARGTPEQASAVTTAATNLGVSPRDLAAAISYETKGTFNPDIVGGKDNNYQGLIQFGPEERMKYGVRPGMTFEQQMGAVENFLRDRGVKPGMGISEIYRTINGGNPNAPLNASDGNGTIAEHIQNIQAGHYGNADKFLGGTSAIDTTDQAGQITKRVQQAFVASARKTWTEIKPSIDSGAPIADDDLKAVQYAAALSGDQAWIKQTNDLAAARKLGVAMADLPMLERRAWLDQAQGQFNETVNKSLKAQFDRQNTMVQGDPVSYWIEKGHPPPRQLDMANSANFRAGLSERASIVQGVAAQEGLSPGSALRASELAPLKATLETASTDTKMALFTDMAVALPEPVYKATMEKLGNDTLTQFVGQVARERPEIAREILRGNDLMSIEKTGDKSSLVRPAFQDKIGRDLYPNAGDQNNVTNAAMALYTARRGTAGSLYDPTDSAGIEKAIEDVAGKITKRNGVKVAIPPGMTESKFTEALSSVTTEQLWQFGGAIDRNGNVFDPKFLGDNAILKQLGPGESNYVIGLRDATARDGFAPVLNSASQPLVINMKELVAGRPATAGFVSALSPYQRGEAAFRAGQRERIEEARRQSLEAP
jgi:hypothetical protein